MRTLHRSPSLVCAASIALAGLLAACVENTGNSGTQSTTTGGSGGTGGADTGGTGGTGSVDPDTLAEYFEQNVLPGLVKECGACHTTGGSADLPFLGDPETGTPNPYDAITTHPAIVVKDPAKSILLVHPNEPSHGGGQAPPISDDLAQKALAWLKLEAASLPEPEEGVPTVTPFKPILGGALNTVYFDEINASLQYASISFNARELDDSILQLWNLEIHPVEGQAIHVIHPLFTVYPKDAPADPDPVDSFSNVDQIFTLESQDLALGTGELILTNWVKDAYLGIAFETITNEGGGGPAVACKDVAKFKAEVVPQMQYCADTCHGGAHEQANKTMDLSGLNADPPDAACAQVRLRITPGDPESSQIFLVTDPTQQVFHMYKFMGNKNKYTAFKTAVSPWILSEAQ